MKSRQEKPKKNSSNDNRELEILKRYQVMDTVPPPNTSQDSQRENKRKKR